MKYIVNFVDLHTNEILERKIDGLEFLTREEAIDFANECFQTYSIVFLENFDVEDGISPVSIDYVVEKIQD